MWPDSLKYNLFGNSLTVFGNFVMVYLNLEKFWSYLGQKNILWGRLSLLRMANYLKIIKPSGHTEKAAKCDSPPLKIILFLSSFRSREEIIERRCRRTIFFNFRTVTIWHIATTHWTYLPTSMYYLIYLYVSLVPSLSMYLSNPLSLSPPSCVTFSLTHSLFPHLSLSKYFFPLAYIPFSV